MDIKLAVKQLRKSFMFDEHTKVGSFLLVLKVDTITDPATQKETEVVLTTSGRVVSINPDKVKPDWWIYEVSFPNSIRGPEKVFWQLRQDQADGVETFTMGGKPMWVAPFVDIISKEEKQEIEGEKQEPKTPGKVIPLFGRKD